MQRRARKKKVDLNELAATIADQATNDVPPEEPVPIDPTKNPHAVALAKLGAKKGGKARWKGTTKAERSKAAQKAAKSRWSKWRQEMKHHND